MASFQNARVLFGRALSNLVLLMTSLQLVSMESYRVTNDLEAAVTLEFGRSKISSGSPNGSVEITPETFLRLAQDPEMVQWLKTVKRKMHETSELPHYQKCQTSALIREELDEIGINYRWPVTQFGAVVALVGTGQPPFVALRAYIDGDPTQVDKSILEEMPQNCSYACHASMLLGASRLLQKHSAQLQGTVILIFQPAEKGGAGAKQLIEEGALGMEQAIFGLHMSNDEPLGIIGSRPGHFLAGSGSFEAIIKGKGGHAAIPQQAVDPIIAGSAIVLSLQSLVSRESNPFDSQVVSVTRFRGGKAYNVIPDSVKIGGTFCALTEENLERLKQRIEQIIAKQAEVYRCTAVTNFLEEEAPSYPPTINDQRLYQHVCNIAHDIMGGQNMKVLQPKMEADDFAFYTKAIRGAYFFFGMRDEACISGRSEHSPFLFLEEEVLTSFGVAMYASIAQSYLRNGS